MELDSRLGLAAKRAPEGDGGSLASLASRCSLTDGANLPRDKGVPKPQGGNGPLVWRCRTDNRGCRIGILLAGRVLELEWEWQLTDRPVVLGPKSKGWGGEGGSNSGKTASGWINGRGFPPFLLDLRWELRSDIVFEGKTASDLETSVGGLAQRYDAAQLVFGSLTCVVCNGEKKARIRRGFTNCNNGKSCAHSIPRCLPRLREDTRQSDGMKKLRLAQPTARR
ncbi:hypothetical protein BDP55DRAFT_297049 [Colletotrichum godetiae]|uniref:Uncharacterized protein n=1 Tax=Colletotrichum godetiae TaxID=1209918 RepID=A0AAJ0AF60_9PEZI|nr:uncharacterized protein BDP55DRAFT_297049 [Colletotrichum godetiae]KAK1671338.1 hypothetical protein BDP55DRAFT_297049 [Colletotrichum godetiae]